MLGRLFQSKDGSSLPMFGVGLFAIFGLVGMSLAISFDQGTATGLQDSADQAALAGATAFIAETPGSVQDHLKRAYDTAYAMAQANFEADAATVNVGAITTDAFGQSTRIDVALQFRPANIFNRMAGKDQDSDVIRRAQAVATRDFPLCVLAMSETGPGVVTKGPATLEALNCIVYANATASPSMSLRGKQHVAASFCAAGPVESKGVIEPEPAENCAPLPDPLADIEMPKPDSCFSMSAMMKHMFGESDVTLSPGTFCGGLEIDADTVSLEPGVYHIVNGPLRVTTNEDVDASGVTFILWGAQSSVEVEGSGGLRLTAPTEGATAGIALAEGDAQTTGMTGFADIVFHGNAGFFIEGLIYAPRRHISMAGNAKGKTRSPLLQIVADTLSLDGNAALMIDFNASESDVPLLIKPRRTARLVD